jgi:hypothetical protein
MSGGWWGAADLVHYYTNTVTPTSNILRLPTGQASAAFGMLNAA